MNTAKKERKKETYNNKRLKFKKQEHVPKKKSKKKLQPIQTCPLGSICGGTLFTSCILSSLLSSPYLTQTVNLLSCGKSRAIFFPLCYFLGLLEEIFCEKS